MFTDTRIHWLAAAWMVTQTALLAEAILALVSDRI